MNGLRQDLRYTLRALGKARGFALATLSAVTVFLAAVAMVATYLPARRAARVNPLEAIRYD